MCVLLAPWLMALVKILIVPQVAAEDAVQAIWLRHPTSVKVNQLMEDGMTELNTKGATPEVRNK